MITLDDPLPLKGGIIFYFFFFSGMLRLARLNHVLQLSNRKEIKNVSHSICHFLLAQKVTKKGPSDTKNSLNPYCLYLAFGLLSRFFCFHFLFLFNDLAKWVISIHEIVIQVARTILCHIFSSRNGNSILMNAPINSDYFKVCNFTFQRTRH